ncbi:proton-translocating transhydrogenase family protein [Sphingobium sufflavum]|uniref:NAD(P) transhydrogenase subunit alpha n=1 Tax=Sphingobium sufflavum TaxID=1129547 RepID=UPI001F325E2F|nr:NAD(P) transhydrogenase subunit alpha [Sphingobium sufflavum]MCE7797562.1 proton-translocating transhydrogenase family protein [Sphingobium sufflavum]
MDFVSMLPIFVLACFIGCYVVRSVSPAAHMPLIAMTSAISSVVIIFALVATAEASGALAKYLGLAGVVLASVNIFGGFAITERIVALYRRNDRL